MTNNRSDSSKGAASPGSGGTKGHRDGIKNPANADTQRRSIGGTDVDQVRGHGEGTVSSIPNKELQKTKAARDKQTSPS